MLTSNDQAKTQQDAHAQPQDAMGRTRGRGHMQQDARAPPVFTPPGPVSITTALPAAVHIRAAQTR
jgi:hypothetical protein